MNDFTAGLRLGRDAAIGGLRFYLRRLPVVLGLAIIPTIQRFVLVYWGHELSNVSIIASEVVTWAARIALVSLSAWWIIGREPRLRPLGWDPRLTRMARYLGSRPLAGLALLSVLVVAVLVFDKLPQLLLDGLVAADERSWADAVLIAVKNPIVITGNFIWLLGCARLMMLAGGRDSAPLPDPEVTADPDGPAGSRTPR